MAVIRPIGDISKGGWAASSGTDLWAMLDESTRNDADFIRSLASAAPPLPTPLASYDFVQGADAATLYDTSGNGYHGTLAGTTLPVWATGPNRLEMGDQGYVTLPTALFTALGWGAGNYTNILKIRLDTPRVSNQSVIGRIAGGDRAGRIRAGGATGFTLTALIGSGNVTSVATFANDTPFVFTARRDGTTGSVGMGGVMEAGVAVAAGTQVTDHVLGRNVGFAIPMRGAYYAARFYNFALTDAEITAVYNSLP